MRRILLFFSLTVLATLASCQTKNDIRQALKKELTATNKQLPQKISFFSITKIEIVNDDYIVNFEIDETVTDLDGYVSTMNLYKSRILTVVFGQNPNFKKQFLASGLNLKMNYRGNISHKNRQIFLSAADIKRMLNSSYSARDLLVDYVLELRKTLPQDWGDGLMLTSADVEGNFICYKIETDESVITMNLLERSKAEGNNIEESIIESLNENCDPIQIIFIKHLKQSGMGLKYIYWSKKASKNVSVMISPQTIKNRVFIKEY